MSETRPVLRPVVAGVLVFWTSGAVLVLEILAARLLAPYVGVTLQTWTGIIGVVLAGIALGTRWGGWLADRYDPARLLGPLIVAGGGLALLTVPVVGALGGAVGGSGGAGPIVALSVAGFFAPAFVLSTVTPLVVKLELQSLSVTGTVVGRLSALGTAGAIAGTFLAGFVLIELAPTSRLIPGLGVALVATGVALWLRLGGKDAGALGASLLLVASGTAISAVTDNPCQWETRYYCVRIDPDPIRDAGRTLVLDNLRHSYVELTDPTHLEFGYIGAFAATVDATFEAGEPLGAVHIGGGGFTMPRWLAATRPGSRSTVLELDGGLVEVVRRQLGLRTTDDLVAVIGDARLQLADLPTESLDVVVGDAFGGLAVPWHLTTVEVVGEVERLLRPGGLYLINLIDRGPMRFARAEVATLQEVFEQVALLGPPTALAGLGGNLVAVASDGALPIGAIEGELGRRGLNHTIISGRDVDDWVDGAGVLTDDFAPVDQLITLP